MSKFEVDELWHYVDEDVIASSIAWPYSEYKGLTEEEAGIAGRAISKHRAQFVVSSLKETLDRRQARAIYSPSGGYAIAAVA